MHSETYLRLLRERLDHTGRLADRLDGRRVFIAGASGFLAANLILFLDALRERHSIDLRLLASSRRNLADLDLWRFAGHVPDVTVQAADVENTGLPDGELVVVHAASYGAPADYMQHPLETFRANTEGVRALLAKHGQTRISHFIFISSAEVYGQPPAGAIPTPEEYVGGLPTADARSIYGESKRMGEVLATSLCGAAGIPLTILRPWNLYGPGQRYADSRVPMHFMRQCLEEQHIKLTSDGSPSRSFCHVWDGILQIASALPVPASRVNVLNIGNGSNEISIRDLAAACLTTFGLPASQLQLGSAGGGSRIARSCPDTCKALSLLEHQVDWIPLATGLETMREWVNFLRRPDAAGNEH